MANRFVLGFNDLDVWVDLHKRPSYRPRRVTSLDVGDHIQFIGARGIWRIYFVYERKDDGSALFCVVNIVTGEDRRGVSEYLLIGARRVEVDDAGRPSPLEVGNCVSVVYGGGRIEPGVWKIVGTEAVASDDPNRYRKFVVENVGDGRVKVFREYVLRRV